MRANIPVLLALCIGVVIGAILNLQLHYTYNRKILVLPLVQKRCPNDREVSLQKSCYTHYGHVDSCRNKTTINYSSFLHLCRISTTSNILVDSALNNASLFVRACTAGDLLFGRDAKTAGDLSKIKTYGLMVLYVCLCN